jgi:hypothetical protein
MILIIFMILINLVVYIKLKNYVNHNYMLTMMLIL